MTDWQKWFAWKPVWIHSADGWDFQMVWLRTVERRIETIAGVGHVFEVTSYRLPL